MASNVTYKTEIRIGARTDSSFRRNIERAERELNTMDRAASKVGKALLTVGTVAVTGAGVAIAKAEETYKGFEQEMANVSSIAKATASEYSMLKASALEAGAKTVYTAEQSAEALEKMSLAGWDVSTSTQALMPILKMAAATNKDLGVTSDLITDSMGALKLDITDLSGYMDMLISANNKSNTTAEQLMQALIKTGGAARTVGADLPDTITALGILANNGTKAEEAGTALNSVLTRMASNSTALKTLDKIGVSLFNKNGQFIGLKESLQEINEAMSNFTDEQKSQTLAGIAGTRRYSLMKYLLDSVKTDAKTGKVAWDELEKSVNASAGSLDSMYATNTDTLKMAEAQLNSAKEDMQIRVVDVFADDQKEFVKWIAGEVPKATDAIVKFAEAHEGEFAEALESAGATLEKFAESGLEAGAWVIENRTAVVGALKGIAAGILTIKAASKGVQIASQISKLGLGPVGALTALTAATVSAGFAIKGFIDNANRQMNEANLEEHFGTIKLSLSEIESIAGKIVGEDVLAGIKGITEATEKTEDALNKTQENIELLKKEDWKINTGITMNKEDSKQYGNEIEQYTKSVEEYAEDRGYQVHVATSLLFGSGSELDLELGDSFTRAQKEIEKQGNELHDYLYNNVNGALLDGVIDIDENKVVQEYLDKVNSIVQQMSNAEVEGKFDALRTKYGGKEFTDDTVKKLQQDLSDNVEDIKKGASDALETAMEGINFKQARGEYTDEQARTQKAEAEKRYHDTISQAAQQSADFMEQTLQGAYPDLQSAIPEYQKKINSIYKEYTDTTNPSNVEGWQEQPDVMLSNMAAQLDSVTKGMMTSADRKALQALMEEMKPTIDMIREEVDYYNSVGEEIPESLKEANDNWNALENIVGGTFNDTSDGIKNKIRADNQFQDFIRDMGIQIDDSYIRIEKKIDDTYSKGYSINTQVRAKLNVSAETHGLNNVQNEFDKIQTYIQGYEAKKKGIDTNSKLYKLIETESKKQKGKVSVAQNAKGGIYDKPLLTTFAEEGPEAAIPINRTRRAQNLWIQTGQMMGMIRKTGTKQRDQNILSKISGSRNRTAESEKSGKVIKFSYNPSIVIKGNASERDIKNALSVSKNELRQMIEEIEEEREIGKTRVSFK